MRVVVTGSYGFIGANLALALRREGHNVLFVDRRSAHPLLDSFGGEMVASDVTEIDASLLEQTDVVLHQAACTDTTIDDRAHMWKENVLPFQHLLDLADDVGVAVVYASSAAVYGNSAPPQRVGAGEHPLNVYGESKLEMDAIARERIRAGSPSKIIGLRYFNVFGPGESHKGHMASMVAQLGAAMSAGRRPRIFADGSQLRDHVYVDDVMEANRLAIRPGAPSGIYNVGTGVATSFNKLVGQLNESLDTDLAPEYFDNPFTGYQSHTCADIGPTADALGFRPRVSLSDGIRAYLASGLLRG